MPRLTRLGGLDAPGIDAALVHCDGEDGRPTEERVEGHRVWFVLRGRFDLDRSRARRVGDPATALLLGRDESFCIRHPDGCGDVCLAVGGDVVEQAVERGPASSPLDFAAFVRLQGLARRMARHEHVEPVELEEALCGALDPPGDRRAASPRDRALADAAAHEIALRFDQRLSLYDHARPHGVSVFSLCRAFRRARGAGVHRTLQRLRVRHAHSLLLDTDWTLARIAAECGFASHAHLTRLFARETGAPPSVARRRGGRARAESRPRR